MFVHQRIHLENHMSPAGLPLMIYLPLDEGLEAGTQINRSDQ